MRDAPPHAYNGIVLFMPTRNRAEIAMQSLDLLLETSFEDVNIIISDNSTDEDQAQRLQAYCRNRGNSNLHYLRPPEPLAMAANMDWLLGQALERFTANHFLCQWDRMVLKPEAFAILRQMALSYPDRLCTFQWDEVLDAKQPVTIYQRPCTHLLLEVKSERLLWLASQSREQFAPKVTNCLMPRAIIQAVHARFGSFCNSITADICFGYRSLALVDSVIVYDRALTVTYGLARSNAHSQQKGFYNQDTKDFLTTLQQQQQALNWATPIPEAIIPGNQTIHEYCLVKNEVKSDRFPDVNHEAYLEMLAAGTRLLENPDARKYMEILLAKHNQSVPSLPEHSSESPANESPGMSSSVKSRLKSLVLSPTAKPFWMTMARKAGIGLPINQKFTFRSSREALHCALHYPARRMRHNYLLHDLLADPASVKVLPDFILQNT